MPGLSRASSAAISALTAGSFDLRAEAPLPGDISAAVSGINAGIIVGTSYTETSARVTDLGAVSGAEPTAIVFSLKYSEVALQTPRDVEPGAGHLLGGGAREYVNGLGPVHELRGVGPDAFGDLGERLAAGATPGTPPPRR